MAYDNIEDFTVDFTLKKDSEYGTRLDVEENFTMIFPSANTQHGPIRELFYTNQAGKNLITEKAKKLDLEVLMDGSPFPIADTELGSYGGDKSIVYYIGRSSQYLHGEHTFTLKYHYVNVMLSDAVKQELYWNANGTGWDQTFSKLTANLHIADADALAAIMSDQTSCYVGRYKTSNSANANISSRCDLTKLSDGYSFTTSDLAYGEGLTFAVDFAPGTYGVPQVKDIYTLVIIGAIAGTAMLGIIAAFIVWFFKKANPKRLFYKNLFVKPEYEPTRGLTVAEGENLMLSGAKKSYVATLLELAVAGKVKIVKGEPTKVLKKDTWKVEVSPPWVATKPQNDMLELLNGGSSIPYGGTIEIKRRTATSHTAALARSYTTHAIAMLKEKGLKASDSSSTKNSPSIIILLAATIFTCFGLPVMFVGSAILSDIATGSYGNIIGKDFILPALALLYIATWVICTTLVAVGSKYKWYSEEGLRAARELEGLKLYITMAEADRLKFLQSVKGADTSSEGIVKLYEKLLPWAALFGAEESWLKELNKYYQTANYDPTWCSSPSLLDVAVFSAVTRSISTNVSSMSSYSSGSSGSGGGSSGGFGGGGGGFSGGGGGGGGGGRW